MSVLASAKGSLNVIMAKMDPRRGVVMGVKKELGRRKSALAGVAGGLAFDAQAVQAIIARSQTEDRHLISAKLSAAEAKCKDAMAAIDHAIVLCDQTNGLSLIARDAISKGASSL